MRQGFNIFCLKVKRSCHWRGQTWPECWFISHLRSEVFSPGCDHKRCRAVGPYYHLRLGENKQSADWSTLIGRAPTLLRSHWSRASLVMLAPAILCHKEPARASKEMGVFCVPKPIVPRGLWMQRAGSLWDKTAGASITREALDQWERSNVGARPMRVDQSVVGCGYDGCDGVVVMVW